MTVKKYITNPKTGRKILKGGKTYENLLSSRHLDGRVNLSESVRHSHRRKSRAHSRRPKKIQYSHSESHRRHSRSRKLKRGLSTSRSLSASLKRTRQPYLRKILKKEIPRATEGRGSRTRGWRRLSPKPGSDRHYLYQKCGRKCFLGEGESFPEDVVAK
jgi:hypothetical protein